MLGIALQAVKHPFRGCHNFGPSLNKWRYVEDCLYSKWVGSVPLVEQNCVQKELFHGEPSWSRWVAGARGPKGLATSWAKGTHRHLIRVSMRRV